jgi:hypothetical protein
MPLVATSNYTTCTYNLFSKYYMTVATVVKKDLCFYVVCRGTAVTVIKIGRLLTSTSDTKYMLQDCALRKIPGNPSGNLTFSQGNQQFFLVARSQKMVASVHATGRP